MENNKERTVGFSEPKTNFLYDWMASSVLIIMKITHHSVSISNDEPLLSKHSSHLDMIMISALPHHISPNCKSVIIPIYRFAHFKGPISFHWLICRIFWICFYQLIISTLRSVFEKSPILPHIPIFVPSISLAKTQYTIVSPRSTVCLNFSSFLIRVVDWVSSFLIILYSTALYWMELLMGCVLVVDL